MDYVKKSSATRVAANPTFNAIKESSTLMEAANQRVYSLQLNKYREGQKSLRESFKKIEEMNKTTKVLDVKMLDLDQKKLSVDNDKLERRKQWIGNLSKDIYINETCQVISDMIRQVVLVKGN
jgi:carboxyl-terminal processing protease